MHHRKHIYTKSMYHESRTQTRENQELQFEELRLVKYTGQQRSVTEAEKFSGLYQINGNKETGKKMRKQQTIAFRNHSMRHCMTS